MRYAKLTVLVFMFVARCFSGYAQQIAGIERKQLLDADWKFFLGDTAAASAKDFNDAHWRSLHLPHDWSIEGKIDPKNPTGNAG